MRTPNKLLILLMVAILAYCFIVVQPPKRTSSRSKETFVSSPDAISESPETSMNENDMSIDSESTARLPASNEEAKDLDPNQKGSDLVKLTLKFTGLKDEKSKLHIALFTSAVVFPNAERSELKEVISANGTTASHQLVLENLGSFAIAVFQDLDDNGILSKNRYGIPTEPYGFSNNARGLMGPPSFKQAEIIVRSTEETCEIHLK